MTASLRAAWTRLGFRFQVAPAGEPVDLEDALAATAAVAREDSRIFWGAATWLHRYGPLVDGRRLGARLVEDEARRVFGALLTASKSPALRSLHPRPGRPARPEPLFLVRLGNPAALADLEARALPAYQKWGFLLADEVLKPAALRPSSWVLRENPRLKIRALLGADLRAEVLSTLIESCEPLAAVGLSRELGRSYAATHAACAALEAGGLICREPAGRKVLFQVPPEVDAWLRSSPLGRPRKPAVTGAGGIGYGSDPNPRVL